MKLPIIQKRFLIVWFLFHSFALFVNLAGIKGDAFNGTNVNTVYLFTSDFANDHTEDFWPFTSFIKTTPIWEEDNIGYKIPIDTAKIAEPQSKKEKEEYRYFDSISKAASSTPVVASKRYKQTGENNSYGGLFNSYGFPEYIFYICLGAGIVLVPKFWK